MTPTSNIPEHATESSLATATPKIGSREFDLLRIVSQSFARRARSKAPAPNLTTRGGDQDQMFGRPEYSTTSPEPLDELPSIPLPRTLTCDDSFVALQAWEGYVTELSDKGFGARLVDMATGEAEDAYIPLNVLSRDDRALLEIGAIFYWSIGRLRDRTDRLHTLSELRFRRLPGLTQDELEIAKKEASTLSKSLGFVSNNTGSPKPF